MSGDADSHSGCLCGLGWRLGSPTTKIGWECLALDASFPVTLFTEMQSLNISILYFSKLWSVQLHPAQLHQASSLITNGLQIFIQYFPSYFIGIARPFQNPSLRKSSCYCKVHLNSFSRTFLGNSLKLQPEVGGFGPVMWITKFPECLPSPPACDALLLTVSCSMGECSADSFANKSIDAN